MKKQGIFNLAEITEGDWWVDHEYVEASDERAGYYIAVGGKDTGGFSVAFAFKERDKKEALANANLIAGAPNMYKTLKTLEQWFKTESEGNISPVSQYELLVEIRRAIGKAEGNEP